MNKRNAWIFAGIVAAVFFTLAVADVLVDTGPFNSVILGDGTAADWCIYFEDGTQRAICWDDSEGEFSANYALNNTFGVIEVSGANAPAIVFNSLASANSGSEGQFQSDMLDTTSGSEEAAFRISAMGDGSLGPVVQMAQDSTNGAYIKWFGPSSPGLMGYTGTTGHSYFSNSRHYEFDDEIFINLASAKLVMTSPDGTCSACGPDNSDVWSCSSITCPS